MNKEDLEEWKKDIQEAQQSYPHFANGPFMRALFKSAQVMDSVSQQVMHLSVSVDKTNEKLSTLNTNLKEASESSDKHSESMVGLTRALVFVAAAQVIATLVQAWLSTNK